MTTPHWRGRPHFKNLTILLVPEESTRVAMVRTGDDDFYVLEDNARTPSGVSYMLENREMMLRLFPELLGRARVAPVETYPDLLLQTLRSVAPEGREADPTIIVLTPGYHNSAFFEHSFLARTATRIVNEVRGINRVVYDITSKPPGTIEWE